VIHDHGQAAGNLLTLIASARLHKLDPEVYLRDVFRVLPHCREAAISSSRLATSVY
jgi:hypothetical protein